MAMNKKGQQVMAGFMVAVMVFIVCSAMIPVLKPLVTTARDSDHLDCTNTSISTGDKATCIVVDFWMFYLIGIFISTGMSLITGKAVIERLKQ